MPSHFNAFTQCSVGLQSFGQWRNPADRTSHGYKGLNFWLDLVQTLERGCVDSLFFADVHGVYDVYQNSVDAGIRYAMQFPGNDPTLMIPALARKHKAHLSTMIRKYSHESTFRISQAQVRMPSEYKTQRYPLTRHTNPYLKSEALTRETLPTESFWNGYER
jgi:hypothetical protein